VPTIPRTVEMTGDERGCIQRALFARRTTLQQELVFTEVQINSNPQAAEAARIIRNEVELISRCLRIMWIVYGEPRNGN
jgi:hypothetical protein